MINFLARKRGKAILITLIIAFLLYLLWPSDELNFRLVELRNLYDVNDIGVADLRQNGTPVRWSTNHSSSQLFDIYPEVSDIYAGLDELNLYQDKVVPGFEPGVYEIPWTKPVRFYIKESTFVIESSGLSSNGIIEGGVQLPWESKAIGEGDVEVDVTQSVQDAGTTYINYKIYGKGKILIQTIPERSNGFPVKFTFSERTDLDLIQIGRLAISPPSRSFVYHSKDRHGLALRNNDSGNTEIFVSRGGARGRLKTVHPEAKDELFQLENGEYRDVILQSGIEKDGCPGRQTAWFDVNADGLLDLYQVCGRGKGTGENETFSNRLYVQTNTGLFEEQASKYDIDFAELGSFKFIHLKDNFGNFRLAMIWVTDSKFEVYAKDQDTYKKVYSKPRAGSNKDKIAIGDRDGDGIWEAMVFSSKGNMYVELNSDKITELNLEELGLPLQSQDGSFIDWDGNGHQEIFCVPQGIFENESGKFKSTGKPDLDWIMGHADVRSVWFDKDADGDMDLWISVNFGAIPIETKASIINSYFEWAPVFIKPFSKRALRRLGYTDFDPHYWESRLYENLSQQKSINIRVQGPPGNPNAIGSQITLIDGKSKQSRHYYVGWSDHSRFSQTHHDIYVTKVDTMDPFTLKLEYPDGRVVHKNYDNSKMDELYIEY